jgi:hypothetical protein
MKKIKLTAKEAQRLAEKLGLDIGDDGRTYYATNEEQTEIWEFDTKTERDKFINK